MSARPTQNTETPENTTAPPEACSPFSDAKIGYAIFYAALIYAVLRLTFLLTSHKISYYDFSFYQSSAERAWGAERGLMGFRFQNLFVDVTVLFLYIFNKGSTAVMAATLVLELGFVLALHYWLHKTMPKDSPRGMKLFILMAGTLGANLTYFAQFKLYRSVGGMNTWHNPTSYGVKPWVIVSFFLFVQMLEYAERDKASRGQIFLGKRRDGFWLSSVFFALALVMMAWGKISGLQGFVPAAVLYVFLWWASSRFSIARLRQCLTFALPFLPSVAYFAYRYFVYFPSDTAGQGAGSRTVFMGFDGVHWERIPIFLWAMSFPIFVTLLRVKTLPKDKRLGISWLTYMFCFFERDMFVILGKSGKVNTDGNTGWGVHYAALILFISSLLSFNQFMIDAHRKRLAEREQTPGETGQGKKGVRAGLRRVFGNGKLDAALCHIGMVWAALYLMSGIFYLYTYMTDGKFML